RLRLLDDGFDDVVHVGERVEIGAGADAPERQVAVRPRQPSLLDELAEALLNRASRAIERTWNGVAQPDAEPGLREHLRDPVAHGSGAHDADPLNTWHGSSSAFSQKISRSLPPRARR